MHVRHTVRISPHFAHNPNRDRPCLYDAHGGESEDHKEAKRKVVKFLGVHPGYGDAIIRYEFPLQAVGRIADVYVTFASGEVEIHEIQLASISASEIDQRTEDYKRAGVPSVIWWLGHQARSKSNEIHVFKKYGYRALIDFEREA